MTEKSFFDIQAEYKDFDIERFLFQVTDNDIERAVNGENLSPLEFLSLISPRANKYLEEMAVRSNALTLQNFGRTIQLYTPLYVSNYCDNQCLYCGFNAKNKIPRKKLTLSEVEEEARAIASTGLKHVLLLCGDSRENAPLSYIKSCVRVLKKIFCSISIEIYPLSEDEYAQLIAEGLDGLTIYQEVYDEGIYNAVHAAGPKKDYRFRLEAPERAARRGMRNVNIGPLLGLGDWRKEAFPAALHARYLENIYPASQVSVSLPRIRPEVSGFRSFYEVTDADLVQMIIAFRIFMPKLGITLSTREEPLLRERLIPLGITKMSAGSTTVVGGRTIAHERDGAQPQFKISDERSVNEIREMISRCGYQPVSKDWISGLA